MKWVLGKPWIQGAMAGLFLLTGVFLIASVWGVFLSREDAADASRLARLLPAPRDDAYQSSNRCQACHPGEYASWHATFHRTMTQPATPETVLGQFDGTTIMSEGLAYRVYRKGEEFWAEMPDPEEMMYVVQGGKPTAFEDIPRVDRRVVMCTGSHHYQTYWVTGDARYGRLLQTLPLIYLIQDERWIPREEGFMRAPGSARMITQWNNHCIACHSTGGNPGLQTDTKEGSFLTQVGELGISCEACHGPAEEHIKAHQNPLHRYLTHHGSEKSDPIVNPENLDHRRSSQVCGQCHGVFVREGEDGMTYATKGVQYQAGDDLHALRYYISFPDEDSSQEKWDDYHNNTKFFRERWWDDGTILAAGREYTAMSDSACYQQGTMSCLTCHSMHHSDPADQLKPEGATSASCLTCHTEPRFNEEVEQHTFHPPTSSGSQCLNCHMPHTSYALFNAIRSHSLRSPNARSSAEHGVPNACNLCHLDKTLSWTQEHLTANYGHPPAPLTKEQEEVSAALLWLLKGHAAQRVITAWHAGWPEAQAASGNDWLAPFQAHLLNDPYGVVRYVAYHALQKLPGFANFAYDFLAPPTTRAEKVAEAIATWENERAPLNPQKGAEILLRPEDGSVMDASVQRLLEERDNRPVDIKE